MIEWLSNTFDLRFYYWTGLNWIILFPTYLIGAGLLALLWRRLTKRMNRAWTVIAPLVAVLSVAPWGEELWIAWNFGQLCRKDAGLFVYKTVEVGGFYDDTTHWWRQLAESKYQFVESREHGSNNLWRVERRGAELKHFKIDHPTANYHYESNVYGSRVAYKITRQESRITDKSLEEIIGRYVEYGRRAPWFFIGLDEPPYSCDGPDGGPTSKHHRLIYLDVLKPIE